MSPHDDLRPLPDTPVQVWAPTGEALPLVCDSPHSGTAYPADFGHQVPIALLRRGEDTHIHHLWHSAPADVAYCILSGFLAKRLQPVLQKSFAAA